MPDTNTPAKMTEVTYMPDMKWFKFIIYIWLFLNALFSIVEGVVSISGFAYGGREITSQIYATYPLLKISDIIFGLLVFCIAIFEIVVRFMLSSYKKHATTCLFLVYAISATVNLFYEIICFHFAKIEISIVTIVHICICVAMIIIDFFYFRKREYLFKN